MEVLLRKIGKKKRDEQRAELDRWTEELFGQRVERHPNGAPYLPCGVGFSVSHTADWLAIAIDRTGTPCGVDIELIDRQVDRLIERFAAPQEIVLAPYRANPGLWVWCAKEALYKVAGKQAVDWLRDIVVTAVDSGWVADQPFSIGWRQEAGLLVVWASERSDPDQPQGVSGTKPLQS